MCSPCAAAESGETRSPPRVATGVDNGRTTDVPDAGMHGPAMYHCRHLSSACNSPSHTCSIAARLFSFEWQNGMRMGEYGCNANPRVLITCQRSVETNHRGGMLYV